MGRSLGLRPEDPISIPGSPLNDSGQVVLLSLSFSSVERGKLLPCPAQRTGFDTPVRQLVKELRHWKAFRKHTNSRNPNSNPYPNDNPNAR